MFSKTLLREKTLEVTWLLEIKSIIKSTIHQKILSPDILPQSLTNHIYRITLRQHKLFQEKGENGNDFHKGVLNFYDIYKRQTVDSFK